MSTAEFMQLLQSLIWLLAGVGVFIVGMNFLSDALEKSAGDGMKKLLGRINGSAVFLSDWGIRLIFRLGCAMIFLPIIGRLLLWQRNLPLKTNT